MSKTPIISIIIPVYGVEKYITKCIESIKKQTLADFEAILINDGTRDNSVAVAEQAIADDERFILLHKENGGQGSARNVGLDHARGDYIAFIDSDDYVEPRFLQAMYEKIVSENADICACGVRLLSENGRQLKVFVSKPELYIEKNDYLNANFYISNWFCDKLFRKELFDNLRFDLTVRTFEDAHLLFRVVYGRDITSIDEVLYNYIQHAGSTSNDIKPTYVNDRVAVMITQVRFAKLMMKFDHQYLLYVYLKTFVFLCATTIARFSKSYNLDIQRFNLEIDDGKFRFRDIFYMVRKDTKVGVSLLLFKLSPQAFRLLVRFWFRNHVA